MFLLEQESDNGELRSMALAARELREPLTNVMIVPVRFGADGHLEVIQ